jgi:hypothetical protein
MANGFFLCSADIFFPFIEHFFPFFSLCVRNKNQWVPIQIHNLQFSKNEIEFQTYTDPKNSDLYSPGELILLCLMRIDYQQKWASQILHIHLCHLLKLYSI